MSTETTLYEAPLEQIWRACEYLRHAEGKKCLHCQRTEQRRGETVQRLCFGMAEEIINVVEAGNPWRDKRSWP